jgi:hypothetical protein
MRYNGDSQTGHWLAEHDDTLPFLLEQAKSDNPVRRMNAVYVISWSFKAQSFSRALIEAQGYFVEVETAGRP